MSPPVALITGAARRIGATLARRFHAEGYRVLIHYHRSNAEAEQLVHELNALRPDTAQRCQADLDSYPAVIQLANNAHAVWGGVDLLINSASQFFPTPIGSVDEAAWDQLMGSNLKAPFFLTQALKETLNQRNGCVINLVDIHAQRPLPGYPVYCAAKAGLAMLTQTLAVELAPNVRVNGIAPGPILPPEGVAERDLNAQQCVINATLLKRMGTPDEIADTALFLARNRYITGQVIAVDGGKGINSGF